MTAPFFRRKVTFTIERPGFYGVYVDYTVPITKRPRRRAPGVVVSSNDVVVWNQFHHPKRNDLHFHQNGAVTQLLVVGQQVVVSAVRGARLSAATIVYLAPN